MSQSRTLMEKSDDMERKSVDRNEMYKKKIDNKDGNKVRHVNFRPTKGSFLLWTKIMVTRIHCICSQSPWKFMLF